MNRLIRRWHIPIMGYTQGPERESGTEKLWRKLRQSGAVSPQSSLVHPQKWNAKWPHLAEFIWRNSEPDVLVNIYAYSWGCGHGFVSLSKELLRRGIEVDHAVLCDPVYHHWLRPWRGMFHATWNPPIVIPDNVRFVASFFQRQDTPQGARLAARSERTIVGHPVRLSCNHAYMDDSAEYHGKVLQVVREASESDGMVEKS